MGAQVPVQRGQMPEQEWPEHAIELRWVELTPPCSPNIGIARYRQTAAELLICELKEVIAAAAVTPYTSLPYVRLNVVRRIAKRSIGNHQIRGYT